MILYSVYKLADWETEKIFDTLDKNKAYNFVKKYNEYVNDDNKCYIIELNLDNIEHKANEIINKYQEKRKTEIYINNNEQKIINSQIQYIDTNNIQDSAEIYDYIYDFNEWHQARVILFTDNEIELDDKTIQDKIKHLLDIEYKFQYNLFHDEKINE